MLTRRQIFVVTTDMRDPRKRTHTLYSEDLFLDRVYTAVRSFYWDTRLLSRYIYRINFNTGEKRVCY